MHPFGEDDDDIELNCILDRHAAVAFSMATEVREESPDIVFDVEQRKAMGQKMSNHLTYSVAANAIEDHPPKWRAHSKIEEEHRAQVPKKAAEVKKATKTPPNFF